MFNIKKYGIVVDSTTVISDEIKNKYNIKIASLNVIIDKESYKEVDLTIEKMEKNIKEKEMKTSQPSPDEYFNCFQELLNEGYEYILCIPMSSGLSGSYQSAILARDLIENNKNIYIYDVKICSFAIENLLDGILPLIDNNVEIDVISKEIAELSKNSNVSFTITELMHLFRGGRLNIIKAALGVLFRVKPVIEMTEEGKLEMTNKLRTYSLVKNFFMNKINYFCSNFKNVFLKIVSLNQDSILNDLLDAIKNKYNNLKITITHTISPVFIVHLGTNGIGISICASN